MRPRTWSQTTHDRSPKVLQKNIIGPPKSRFVIPADCSTVWRRFVAEFKECDLHRVLAKYNMIPHTSFLTLRILIYEFFGVHLGDITYTALMQITTVTVITDEKWSTTPSWDWFVPYVRTLQILAQHTPTLMLMRKLEAFTSITETASSKRIPNR